MDIHPSPQKHSQCNTSQTGPKNATHTKSNNTSNPRLTPTTSYHTQTIIGTDRCINKPTNNVMRPNRLPDNGLHSQYIECIQDQAEYNIPLLCSQLNGRTNREHIPPSHTFPHPLSQSFHRNGHNDNYYGWN